MNLETRTLSPLIPRLVAANGRDHNRHHMSRQNNDARGPRICSLPTSTITRIAELFVPVQPPGMAEFRLQEGRGMRASARDQRKSRDFEKAGKRREKAAGTRRRMRVDKMRDRVRSVIALRGDWITPRHVCELHACIAPTHTHSLPSGISNHPRTSSGCPVHLNRVEGGCPGRDEGG